MLDDSNLELQDKIIKYIKEVGKTEVIYVVKELNLDYSTWDICCNLVRLIDKGIVFCEYDEVWIKQEN